MPQGQGDKDKTHTSNPAKYGQSLEEEAANPPKNPELQKKKAIRGRRKSGMFQAYDRSRDLP